MKKTFISIALLTCICCALSVSVYGLQPSTPPIYTPTPEFVPELAAVTEIDVPIIMYHKVTNHSKQLGKLAITPKEFESDLQFLQENGYTAVTMDDLIRFVHAGGSLPEKPIVLSFDDGFFSDYRYVFPLLTQYNIRAVSAIIGYITDEYTEEGRKDILYPHMTWEQIREMADSGLVEFQNHSYDLHKTGGARVGIRQRKGEPDAEYKACLEADLGKLQMRMQEEIGKVPTTFVYPFGATGKGSDAALAELGFSASLACETRINCIARGDAACLFRMGRLIRPHGKPVAQVLKDAHL